MIDANQYIWGYANIYYIYVHIDKKQKNYDLLMVKLGFTMLY